MSVTDPASLDREANRIPEANRPGHRPEHDQDKPSGPPPLASPARFDFLFDSWMRPISKLFGADEGHAFVEVDQHGLDITFGPWHLHADHADIARWSEAGPYHPLKVMGPPHLSLADRGITFATSCRRGICIELARPRPAIDPFGLIRHPNVTVTLADPEGFGRALERWRPAATA